MVKADVSLTDDGYAIVVNSYRTAGALSFRWSIVNARTRAVVQASSVDHRSMEVAFAAAGPTPSLVDEPPLGLAKA